MPAAYSRVRPKLHRLQYLIRDPAYREVSLHCPDYVEPDQSQIELDLVNRIFQSFKKMKEAEQLASKLYHPSPLWREHINTSYAPLASGVKNDDIHEFHLFLANFGTWKQYHGIESNILIRQNMASIIGRRYLRNDVFYKPFKTWEWFYNARRHTSRLNYPTHGNQAGCYIDKAFVGVGSFFNDIYGSMLAELIKDADRPVVAELGAGYGKMAYFTLRDSANFSFIDFDLPETLCLAAYYLMKTWPNKPALLFGEELYSPDSHSQYDLIFMPSFEIEQLGVDTVDLFINKNSLGEMTRDAANNFVNRIADASKLFFHMNIENNANLYSDGTFGPLGSDYPVPKDEFRLLFRYPDIGHLLAQGYLDFRQDIFMYLYERKATR